MRGRDEGPGGRPDEPGRGELVGYALGDTASNFFFQTLNMFLTKYYVDVWGLPATVLLWMYPVLRALGAFDDVLMGLIVDRTQTRWGKFRPYLLFGAVPYGVCGFLMFAGPDLSPGGKVVYACITYGLMLLSYTVINVPYSSLLGVLSPSPRTRTVASTYRFVGAFSAVLLISLFFELLVERTGGGLNTRGYRTVIAMISTAAAAMFLVAFLATRERVTPPPSQKTDARAELRELFGNGPWLTLLVASIFSNAFSALRAGSTLFFIQYVLHDDGRPILFGWFNRSSVFFSCGALGLVAGTLCLGRIARRVDKKHYAAALSVVTGACFISFFFLPRDNFPLLLAVNVLAQLCAGPTTALTWALYGDVADYGEWRFGRRSTGLIYSASLFSIKTGMLVGGFLVPWFLVQFGFVKGGGTQTDSAVLGIMIAFTIAPGIFAFLKAGALLIYPLDQGKVDQIEHELRTRRAVVAAGAPISGSAGPR